MHARSLRFAAIPILLAVLPVAAAAQEPFTLTAETLASVVEEIRPLVEKETGVSLAEGLPVRLAGRAEVRAILEVELGPQMEIQFGPGETAALQTRVSSMVLAQALLAKLAFEKGEILVLEENFAPLAAAVDEPGLLTPQALKTILIHEFVHAADQRAHDIRATLTGAKSTEALQAFNAVVEGHAQFVTRRICAAQGWEEAFEVFTRSIGKVPEKEGQDEGTRFLMRILTQAFASAYYDGERFVETLHRLGGPAAVARAFTAPPGELELIHNPAWFLDPASRRPTTYDFDRALGVLAPRFPEDRWSNRTLTLSQGQITTALTFLPEDVVQRIVANLKSNRLVVFQPKDAPGSKLVAAALYEFTSPDEAVHYVAATERLNRLKDEKMKEGALKVTEAVYEAADGESWHGFVVRKVLQLQGESLAASSVCASRGPVGVEIVFSNEEADAATLKEIAAALLDGVRKRGEPEREEDGAEDAGEGK